VALGGCAITMVEPARPSASDLAQGLTFAQAVDYLERARANMSDSLATVDKVDGATRVAVGVGVGGAALNTLARGSADLTLGLLGLGAIGYGVAQTTSLPGQRDIYNAGLNSLDCIERTGYRVYRETSNTRVGLLDRRRALTGAIATLAQDLDEVASTHPPETAAVALEPHARSVLQSAVTLDRSLGDFLNATDVGPEIFYGVNKTVRAVNTQLHARAPSLDDIARAGTILTGFISAHTPVAASAQTTTSAAAKVPGLGQAAHPLADRIQRDVQRLAAVAREVQTMLPPSGFASAALLDACQALAPGQLPFRVRPEGPVRLTAGGEAYSLSVESELPVIFGFHGPQPSAQQLVVSQPSDRTFSLAAPSGAKPGDYQFYIAQRGGRDLPDLQVTVLQSTPNATETTQKTKREGDRRGSAGLALAAKLTLLGLPSSVPSEDDVQFKDRVKKLDNCFGITPSTGAWSDKLLAALRRSEPVNSAGDCPKPKAANTANPPASAASAGQAVIPIPKPPDLGASR
jgi:hypothetical protein